MAKKKDTISETLYYQMLSAHSDNVWYVAAGLAASLKTLSVKHQVLGIAALLLCMLHKYGLEHTEVLGIADGMVFSGENNNIHPHFQQIVDFYMTSKEEI